MSEQTKDPPAPMNSARLGELVRRLRQAAGLTRRQLGQQTKLADSTIKGLELGRYGTSAATIRKLLTSPCMSSLPERAKSASLDLGLGDNGVDDTKEWEK